MRSKKKRGTNGRWLWWQRGNVNKRIAFLLSLMPDLARAIIIVVPTISPSVAGSSVTIFSSDTE